MPNFDITIDSTNEPVEEGQDLEVNYTVTNTGSSTGTQDVNLYIDEDGPDYTHSLDSMPTTDSTYASNTISFVSNPSGSGTVCQTEIPSGQHEGGYFIVDSNHMVGYHPDEVHQRYYIYFGPNTAPTDDCKAPGFSGDNARDLSGETEPDGYNGWSARGSYHQDDAIGNYIYHVDQPDWWGTYEKWNATYTTGQWYQIDQYINLNTPGSNDGVIKGWVDGNLVFDSGGWRWRDTSDLGVEGFWHDFYHGGNNTPNQTYYVYTRDYAMWADKGEQL